MSMGINFSEILLILIIIILITDQKEISNVIKNVIDVKEKFQNQINLVNSSFKETLKKIKTEEKKDTKNSKEKNE